MSNEETVDVEIIPEDQEVDVEEETNDSEENVSEEDNSLSEKKKSESNFKKLSKQNKANLKRALEAEKRLADLLKQEDGSEEEEAPEVNDLETRLFFIENPDAKPYRETIEQEMQDTPGLTLSKAFALAKASQSTTTQDIPTGQSRKTVRKKLSDLTDEEALKLPNSQYLAYLRTKGTKV